jgi:hypothetical protein
MDPMKESRSQKPRMPTPPAAGGETPLDLRHLRREARTALELAIVALAPADLIDQLAAAAGLLEAINELPADSPPALALAPKAAARARSALDAWREYDERYVRKALA